MSRLLIENIIFAVKIVVIFGAVLTAVPFMVLLERVLIARIQQRVGPNRVGLDFIPGLGFLKGKFIIGGILQAFIDGAKLFLKEEVRVRAVDPVLWRIAPLITLVPAIMILAIVPFGPPIGLNIFGDWYKIPLAITDLEVGILFYLAVTGVAVYGIVLAGYSSNSKYSLIGGIRSSAQMISYEIALSLSLVGVLLIAGSFSLSRLIGIQSEGVWNWNIWKQPIGAALFLIAGFAESNRLPFDLPEGESELGAGFHTEYSSMKFAMFFMAEYMNMFSYSAILTTLFLGGFYGPIPLPASVYAMIDQPIFGIVSGVGSAVIGVFWFSVKVFLLVCLFVWIRGTLPRFRYDQLMDLGWKVMLPAALVNMVVTAAVIALVAKPISAAPTPDGPALTIALLVAGVVQVVAIDRILTARKRRILGHAH
ncbi:NADH-quinone oxidoreductase subunit H [bacterium]|nr:NADH-quinone oxidoreductase subunit H [bacterium]